MKVLILADEESRSLWDYYDPQKTRDVELIPLLRGPEQEIPGVSGDDGELSAPVCAGQP